MYGGKGQGTHSPIRPRVEGETAPDNQGRAVDLYLRTEIDCSYICIFFELNSLLQKTSITVTIINRKVKDN